MDSLFSSFDAGGGMNWLLPLLFGGGVLLPSFWLLGGCLSKAWEVFVSAVYRDIGGLFLPGGAFWFLSLFLVILCMNFLGLFPYVFTGSSHICVTLGLGLPLWVGGQVYCWVKQTNHSFAHLVPEGAPNLLIPLLTVIELVSLLIRPFTLSVRLMANMVAGHLLLALLGGGASINAPLMGVLVVSGVVLMIVLELGVSLIQGYVFMLLSCLYTEESVY